MDPVLLALAEQVLGCMPVLDFVHGLASRPGSDSVDQRDRAAQHFHSDHDRLRFVKVFVYLDDVDMNNGPHVFCEGTHRQRPQSCGRAVDCQMPWWKRMFLSPTGGWSQGWLALCSWPIRTACTKDSHCMLVSVGYFRLNIVAVCSVRSALC